MAFLRRLLWILVVTALSSLGSQQPPALQPPRQLIASYNDEQSATIRWEAVPNARYYRFQISEQRDFTTIRTDALLLQGKTWIRATVAGLEPGRTYWWRVQAINDAGESPWSAAVRLSTMPVTLGVPAERFPVDKSVLAFASTLRCSWQRCEGATSYRFQISTSPDFHTIARELECIAPFADVVDLSPGMQYYWRVRAQRGSERGQWSPANQFTIVPLLGSHDQQPEHATSAIRLLNSDEAVPVELSPNPVSEVLTVRAPALIGGGSVALYNVLGRKMLDVPVAGTSDVMIPVGQLVAGSYTIVISAGDTRWVGTVEVLR